MDVNLGLSELEKEWWKGTVQSFRAKIVKTPQHYVDLKLKSGSFTKESLEENVESLLVDEREEIYKEFVASEAELNAAVISHLVLNREIPRTIFDELVESHILNADLTAMPASELKSKLAGVIGEYTGTIFPYLFELSLSNTQSRRSRAGKTFEFLLETALELMEIPFANQSQLGRRFFQENGIGKKVDLVIPGSRAYEENRSKCAVLTAKTSLRERWQEVVEELQRSNVPHIYLATLDESLTSQVVQTMKQHNITLVVKMSEKQSKFGHVGTVESFHTFFNSTLPHLMEVWPNYAKK